MHEDAFGPLREATGLRRAGPQVTLADERRLPAVIASLALMRRRGCELPAEVAHPGDISAEARRGCSTREARPLHNVQVGRGYFCAF